MTLDASGTRDPDGDRLKYRWFAYREANAGTGQSRAVVTLRDGRGRTAKVTPTSTCPPVWLPDIPCTAPTGIAHVILAVTDNGSPRLTSYRRVMLEVHASGSGATARADRTRRHGRRAR